MENESLILTKNEAAEVVRHVRGFMGLSFAEIGGLFREAGSAWLDDKAPRLAASLAYYTLLSIAPLLVMSVAVAAIFFGKKAVEGQLFWQIKNLIGAQGARTVQDLLKNADHMGSGMVASIAGIIVLLFAASSVVIELEDALNTIWHTPVQSAQGEWNGILSFLKARLFSFGVVLGTGLLLLVSLVLNTVIALVGSFFGSRLPAPALLLHIAEFALAFFVTTMLFAAIYKIMPAIHLNWSDVFIGASVTSLLFTAGKQLIGIYLGREGLSSTYGAAGSLVAVLVWVYYSAQLFFLGAEFTKVYTTRFGSLRPRGKGY